MMITENIEMTPSVGLEEQTLGQHMQNDGPLEFTNCATATLCFSPQDGIPYVGIA